MQFNILQEPMILLAAGISLIFFPKLLRASVSVILSMAEYFRDDTKSLLPAAFLPGTTGKGVFKMNAVKVAAIVLIVVAVLGMSYGSFTYTKGTHDRPTAASTFPEPF